MRVVVVGGGVIGCAIAYELAREGVGVVVLDANQVGRGASGAAAGHLTALERAAGGSASAPLAAACIDMTASLVGRLRDETGIDASLRECGTLRIPGDEADATRLRAMAEAAPDWFDCHWLDGRELAGAEPRLVPFEFGALLSPREGVLDSYQYTAALARGAALKGADVREGVRVTGFYAHGGEVTGVRTNDGNVAADQLVVAAGTWSGELAGELGIRIPVTPVRGQIVAVRTVAPAVRHTIYGPRGSLTPRPDGATWLGATVEDAGFRPTVTTEGVARLTANAISLAPELSHAQFVTAWAGLRPMTPDDQPVICRSPGFPNVTVATGHYRAGIMLAAPTARVVADMVLGRSPSIPIEGLGVDRFAAVPAIPGGSNARSA